MRASGSGDDRPTMCANIGFSEYLTYMARTIEPDDQASVDIYKPTETNDGNARHSR
jgi:hypothetical protein